MRWGYSESKAHSIKKIIQLRLQLNLCLLAFDFGKARLTAAVRQKGGFSFVSRPSLCTDLNNNSAFTELVSSQSGTQKAVISILKLQRGSSRVKCAETSLNGGITVSLVRVDGSSLSPESRNLGDDNVSYTKYLNHFEVGQSRSGRQVIMFGRPRQPHSP